MRPGRRVRWHVALALLLGFAGLRSSRAQLTATLDAGVSRVEYDGFLPSGAISLTPTVAVGRRVLTLSGRGSVLVFESGNHSFQGVLAASAVTSPTGRLRGEFAATAGASRYENFARFAHVSGRARALYTVPGRASGGWLGALGGRAVLFGSARPFGAVTLGAWNRRQARTLALSATATRVGDTAYTDLEGTLHWPRGALELDGWLGARVWSRGAGHGVFGEAAAAVSLGPRIALVVGGGRYPMDPTRGSVSGRYLSVGMRLSMLPDPSPFLPPTPPPPTSYPSFEPSARVDGASSGDHATARFVTLEVRGRHRGAVGGARTTLRVLVAEAMAVEITGDFTDWQPVALHRTAEGIWEIALAIAPGIHRINVRLNGGEWLVPSGARVAEDEFGGTVGLLVVP
ncbi:MAG: glycogen-binding domain-containing protein [Gemmatimonadales bacterium]